MKKSVCEIPKASKKTFHNDPETLEEALKSTYAEKWKLDMDKEVLNLKSIKTWDKGKESCEMQVGLQKSRR